MGLTRIRAEQISDIDYKQAVRVIQRTNITLTGGAPSSVDGVNLSANDRILVSGQDAGAQNGIYRVQTLGTGANGTWVRTNDGNTDGEIEAGMIIMVTEGEVYKDTQWKLTTNNPIIIGTTPLTFVINAVSVIGGENTQVQYNASGTLAGSANLTFDGTSLTVGGNVSATYFVGNGSALTGISTSTDRIFSGDSNVDIATANANITMSVNGTPDVAVISEGLIAVDGNVSADYFLGNGSQLTGIQAGAVTTVANTAPVTPAQGDIWIDSDTGVQYIYFTSGGNSQWAEMEADQSFSYTSTGGNYSDSNVVSLLSSFGSNSISTTGNVTASNVITGNIVVSTDTITSANSTITIDPSATGSTGLVIIAGNLQVQGNTTTIDSNVVTINDKVFNVANNASTSSQANNAGIAVGPVGSEYATFLYNDANVSWKSNLPLETSGNITAGNITASGTVTATTVVETSSMVLKENIRPLSNTNPLDAILQLTGQIYDRRDGTQKDETGLIAEDVYKVLPNLVGLDDNGNPASVRYTRLTVYLLEAIKSLKAEIQELKQQTISKG